LEKFNLRKTSLRFFLGLRSLKPACRQAGAIEAIKASHLSTNLSNIYYV